MKIRLGCLGFGVLLMIAAAIFFQPITEKLFDDAYTKTTERVVLALPLDERAEAEEMCATLHRCFREQGVDEKDGEAVEAFRKASFDMLSDQEVSTDEARAHLERVQALLESAYPDAWTASAEE